MFSVASQFREFEVAPRGHQFKTGDHRCEEYDLRLLFVCSRLVFFFLYYLHAFTPSLPGQELYVPDLLLCSGLQIEFILMW